MSIKLDKLKKIIYKATGLEWEVWFENKYGGRWMFHYGQYPKQRLGYNYLEAKDFIETFDLSLIIDV